MSANQTAMSVVSHNVANAATEGYSRQRAVLTPGVPQVLPFGVVGTGVRVDDVERVRDQLLDMGFRDEMSWATYWERRGNLLYEIQSLHGDLNGPGLATSLDNFFNAWSDLANDPSSITAKRLVRQSANDVIDHLRRLNGGLDQLRVTTDERMRQDVVQLNQLATTVAQINHHIVAAEAGGYTAGDLRDQRDTAIDQMSKLANTQVVYRSDGTVSVNVDGVNVVDGADAVQLSVSSVGGVWSLVNANGVAVRATGGSIGANLVVLNTDIQTARGELDSIARELASAVNGIHTTGMNAAGTTNILFFDDQGGVPANVTAANIALSADVAADVNAIVAGTPATDPVSGLPVYGAARNDVALALSGLRSAANPAFGGRSISDGYAAQVGRIGAALRAAEDAATVHASLASESDVRRLSVSGVNIDEEMVSLIKYQNAYAAAAKLVTAADEMLQTLLDMKR
jgi:flagellar hook-associated protein 1 FlgK